MRNRNQTKRVLPATITDKFGTLAVEMRKMPRPYSKDGGETLMVYDGLATVVKTGDAETLEEGMMFKLTRRMLSARKIEVKPSKFRGSSNHHKFLVIIHDGQIVQGAV